MTPSGSTTVVGVIGDPVAQSRSPAMHNAAFEALGLDWTFVAFPVPTGAGEAAVRAVPVLGLAGLSVTMPHKAAAAAACDHLSDVAAALGAVNTVIATADGLVGESTDGAGFLRALGDISVDAAGSRVVVFGAGGAARAIVAALGGVGADVGVVARRADAATACADLAATASVIEASDVADAVAQADVLVHATPLGMAGEDPPFRTDLIAPTHTVVDIVTTDTPLLVAARAVGATAQNGIPMLVHQGAIAFERWTGREAPIDIMRSAAEGPA